MCGCNDGDGHNSRGNVPHSGGTLCDSRGNLCDSGEIEYVLENWDRRFPFVTLHRLLLKNMEQDVKCPLVFDKIKTEVSISFGS